MEFSRQEHWSGLLFPCPGDLPYPGIEPASVASPALAGRLFANGATREAQGRVSHGLSAVGAAVPRSLPTRGAVGQAGLRVRRGGSVRSDAAGVPLNFRALSVLVSGAGGASACFCPETRVLSVFSCS